MGELTREEIGAIAKALAGLPLPLDTSGQRNLVHIESGPECPQGAGLHLFSGPKKNEAMAVDFVEAVNALPHVLPMAEASLTLREEHAALVEGVRGLAADLRRVAGMYKDAPSMGYLQGKADAYGRAAERLDALLTNAPPSRYDALVERVRGLHLQGADGVYGQTSLACNGCKEMWPCRTIRLLADEMEARQ